MLKKQRIRGVKGSALEKTCWDENVQLNGMISLCFFVSRQCKYKACAGMQVRSRSFYFQLSELCRRKFNLLIFPLSSLTSIATIVTFNFLNCVGGNLTY